MEKTLQLEDGVGLCRDIIKRKLLLPGNVFRGHEKERNHLSELLRRTVEMGESNSALLIGPRGCGKTTVSFPFCGSELQVSLQLYNVLKYLFFFSS
jgi:ATPase related to the helicase subunit of the Holliday junction resolvase